MNFSFSKFTPSNCVRRWSFIALLLASQSSFALLTHNLSLANPKALSLANAVTADPPSIDSIHFNPAGLAKLKGRQYQTKLFIAHMVFKSQFGELNETGKQAEELFQQQDPLKNTSGKTSDPTLMLPIAGLTDTPAVALPFVGFAYQPEDAPFTIATAFYAPMGVGYRRGEDDPGKYQGEVLSAVRLTYLSPSIAYQLNEQWSAGASLGISWQGLGAGINIRAPNIVTGLLTGFCISAQQDFPDTNLDPLCPEEGLPFGPFDDVTYLELEVEDKASFSINLGLLWEPSNWLAVGMVYQSEATSRMKGDYFLDYSSEWGNFWSGLWDIAPLQGVLSLFNIPLGTPGSEASPLREEGTVRTTMYSPAHMSIGTSVKVTPELKVNFDLKWTDYSSWESLDFKFDQDIDFLRIASILDGADSNPDLLIIRRDYRAVTNIAIGAEWIWDDQLTLRAGFEDRPSAIPSNKADVLLPIGDSKLFSGGFSYRVNPESTLEFAIGYISSSERIPAESSTNANAISNSQSIADVVYNPYAALNISTDTDAYLISISYSSQF